MFGNIFSIFLPLSDALSQKIFNLTVYGTKIIFCPGCDCVIQFSGETERNLLLFIIFFSHL